MTHVLVKAGHASVIGECKRLIVSASYPSSDGPRGVCIYLAVDDSASVCDLQEAIGGENLGPCGDDLLPRLPDVDSRVVGGFHVSDRAAIVEQIQQWLACQNRIEDIPTEWIRWLLREYELQRAKTDIANQKIERLEIAIKEMAAKGADRERD